jgi:hypothetical protein
MRTPVGADRGNPEELGVLDHSQGVLPRRRDRIRRTEAGIEFSHGVREGHGILPSPKNSPAYVDVAAF